jgi:predicted Zn finger-like uncharacterized protein
LTSDLRRRAPDVNAICPGCQASYFVDEKKVPSGGGRLTCRKCGIRWEIFRPETAEVQAVTAGARPAPGAPAEPEPKRRAAARKPEVTTSKRSRSDNLPPPAGQVACPKCGHEFVPELKSRPSSPMKERRVVLLVEDQKYFTELTREALGTDYRVICVSSKDEALKVVQAEEPSLMILDLSLARGQDGSDLLRAIPGKSFPVLIFTARDETELYGDAWKELQRLGANDIVRKGMNVGEELRRKVASLLPPL